MSEARTAIFSRLQAQVPGAAEGRQRVQARLAAPCSEPRPQLTGDLLARFRAKAEALSSTTDEVAGLSDAPAAVARYLADRELAGQLVVAPALKALDWAAAGLQVALRGARDADRVGVTGCDFAIAETGTILLLSAPDCPPTVSLLPETHIALVPASRVLPSIEDVLARLRAAGGELPRALNFISGPSRTGDIEQTIVLGAHGPCAVHLLIYRD